MSDSFVHVFIKTMAGDILSMSISSKILLSEFYTEVQEQFFPEVEYTHILLYRQRSIREEKEEKEEQNEPEPLSIMVIPLLPGVEEVFPVFIDSSPFPFEIVMDDRMDRNDTTYSVVYSKGMKFYLVNLDVYDMTMASDENTPDTAAYYSGQLAISFPRQDDESIHIYQSMDLPRLLMYKEDGYSWGESLRPHGRDEINRGIYLVTKSFYEHPYFRHPHRYHRIEWFGNLLNEWIQPYLPYPESNNETRL